MIKLGMKAKCKVTGVEGILICRASYLHGVDRWEIQQPKKEDGSVPDSYTVDECQLEITDEKQVVVPEKRDCLVKLGQRAQDTVSDHKGIIIGLAETLNGCWRVAITPKKHMLRGIDGASWFDDGQVKVLAETPVVKEQYKATGGPAPSKPNRNY